MPHVPEGGSTAPDHAVPLLRGQRASRPLHVAMVGQKGLPATYGGVEHHVEEVGRRLVERGHRVTVYCREGYGGLCDDRTTHLGMELVTTPAIRSKHLDAITHSATSTASALRAGVDVVHLHALGPGLLSPLVRLSRGARVVQTVHGLDHERAKWGGLAQRVLGLGHEISGRVPDELVVVSRALQEHYARRFGRRAVLIPNGAPPAADVGSGAPPEVPTGDGPERCGAVGELVHELLGPQPPRYLLFVGRLVPEKRPDLLLRAFRAVPGDVRLVVVGDSSFSDEYTASLVRQAAEDPRVVMTGYQYGDVLQALHARALAFVQPSALEGMPLTVLEALSAGARVVASDIAPHVELLGRAPSRHALVPVDDEAALAAAMRRVLAQEGREGDGGAATDPVRARVLREHCWERSTDLLEQVYLDVVARRSGAVRRPPAAGAPSPARRDPRARRRGGSPSPALRPAAPAALPPSGGRPTPSRPEPSRPTPVRAAPARPAAGRTPAARP
ncbi:glycosyltransferase family 4 protein [uncultured Pseudokineococcus sp.]|uniref:glycosyltransferase family 4 protein n=1 Tax=uncultured Pseudokineococcus sp. TaxID=1642928 RepID=UPI002638F2C1|nr:glycosyltransferase family 4 protein [uncultured Pseudokineococcus sp.]